MQPLSPPPRSARGDLFVFYNFDHPNVQYSKGVVKNHRGQAPVDTCNISNGPNTFPYRNMALSSEQLDKVLSSEMSQS